MSKPVIAVFAIAAVAVGGYSAAWFKYSGDAKNALVHWMDSVNEKTKPLLKDGEVFHYDSIEAAGFPFSMKLIVNKPVISLPVDGFLRVVPNTKFDKSKIPADFTWVSQISFANNVTLDFNLTGSQLTATGNGEATGKTFVNGALQSTMVSDSSSAPECHIQTSPAGFFSLPPEFKDVDSFTAMFHGMDCQAAETTTKDGSGAPIASFAKVRAGFNNVKGGGNRTAGLKLEVDDLTYTAAADPYANDFMKTFAVATGQTLQTMPYSLAELGKTNVNIDFDYDGPDTMQGLSNKDLKMHVNLNALDFSSSLLTSSTQFHLMVEPDGANRKGTIALHSKTNVTERYDQVLAANTKQVITDLSKTEGKTGKDLEIAQDLAKLGQPDALVATLLPKFHTLGDMTLDLDATLSGPNQEAAFFTQGHHVLSALNILTTPYGIKLSGEANGSSGKPAGHLDASCLNCDAMIDDAGSYIMRLTSYLDATNPDEKHPVHAGKAFYDGVKKFAHSIALNGNDPAAKDLNINVVMKETGEFTVSGKQVMEVMQSYMTNVTANMPVQPPVTGPDTTPALPPLVRPQPQQ